MEKILTTKQMSFCEQKSDAIGISLEMLMDNAGEKLGRKLLDIGLKAMKSSVVFLVGKGNNGGDGLVAANFLCNAGIQATVVLCCGKPATKLSSAAFDKLSRNVRVMDIIDDNTLRIIENADILCDCIFGTGFHGSLRDNVKDIFIAANKSKGYKLACDVPSGANAANGQCDPLTFKADETITFHRTKLGLTLSPCRYFCGKITVADISVSEECEENLCPQIMLSDDEYIKEILPERVPYGHKGTFGKLVIVCGSDSYIGAAALCTSSALRSGIGLCNLCTTKAVAASVSQRIIECTYSAMKNDDKGFMTSENVSSILEKCKTADCLLIGCGLGHTKETEKLVSEIVENCSCPIVIDADGINSLATNIDVLQKKKSDVILTPHPMELARLCGCTIDDIKESRLEKALELANKYHITIYAKNAESMAVDSEKCIVVRCGNTALAKGGSGDMLAGLIASFRAQGLSSLNACVLGGSIMGETAQMLTESCSERSVLAEDIISAFGSYFKHIED